MTDPVTNMIKSEPGDEKIRDAEIGDSGENTPVEPPAMLKYISLVLLTLQNSVLILVMRHVRTQGGDMFMSTTAVIMTEFFKLFTALGIIFIQEGGFRQGVHHLYENIIQQPVDCAKVSVPSFIYVLQNNLLYVAVSNLDAATFQVSYQLKILTTAILSVLMLHKYLTRVQWVSLVVLFIGVSIVQMQPENTGAGKVATEQKPILGFVAVLISCVMSGFAGVYFEKILKGTKQSVWLRNVQLACLGVVIGLITMMISDGAKIKEKGFFFGYNWVVWVVIGIQAFGGLLVAVVVKYADNILKGFATSAAIVISCVASMYFFDFRLSIEFTVGAVLVIFSVYMYSKFAWVATPLSTQPNQRSL